MAQKVQVLLEDDIDGSEATETVSFGLDGQGYEIDLNAKHADALRKAFATYVEHGRHTTAAPRAGRGRRRTSQATASNGRVNPNDVRAWAKSQGIDVKDRGRVPAELVIRFQAANS